MYVSPITHSNQNNFKAKFLHTESLRSVVEYSVEHNKFDKLNEARKRIDLQYEKIRIKVEIGTNENGFPFITFYRYKPKDYIIVPNTENDYIISKPITLTSGKKMVTEKFALKELLRLSNSAPHNKLYQRIVVKGQ